MITSSLTIGAFDHAGKGSRIIKALELAGHAVVPAIDRSFPRDINLLDSDRHESILDLAPIVLYPHGGNFIYWWGDRPPHRNVRLMLVHGPGDQRVLETCGSPIPSVIMGWSYSDLLPLRCGPVRKVLFCPAHPRLDGYMEEALIRLNQEILLSLLHLGLDVAVRHWGSRSSTNLDLDSPVTWIQGGGLDTKTIDESDLVIAIDTTLSLAVARGVPAITFGQSVQPSLCTGPPYLPYGAWQDYKDIIRYPFDVNDGDMATLISIVTESVPESVQKWRDEFVGESLDVDLVVQSVLSAVD